MQIHCNLTHVFINEGGEDREILMLMSPPKVLLRRDSVWSSTC
jgi:hypothetical protein